MNPVESIAHSILQSPVASRQAAARAARLNADRAEARRRARQVQQDHAVDKPDAGEAPRDATRSPRREPDAKPDEHVDLRA